MARGLVVLSVVWLWSAAAARGQPPASSPPPGQSPLADTMVRASSQGRWELVSSTHLRYVDTVQIEFAGGEQLFADEVDIFLDTRRAAARGNVVFGTDEGRIAADRMEFDLAKGTGVFVQAFGVMTLGEGVDRAQFGGQDPDVYFYGERIEKVGPRRYQITRGGFTTCVQPTPRWEIVSESVALNLNEYAIARNTVLRVKGVPLMYLPLIYYPIQDDERATGFLLPTYGTSTLRGQAVSNAFFWAIGRSHDATFFHDWFTRAGQGLGTEYRYIAGPQSAGDLRVYRFGQRETTYTRDGAVGVLPDSTSFELAGSATHVFHRTVRARARVDYFTDIVSQQLYHQNVYLASRRSRLIEGSLSAGLGPLSTSVLYQRSEAFGDAGRTHLYGSTPRVYVSLSPQRLFGAPIYLSMNSEYAYLPYRSLQDGVATSDNSLTRVDVSPTIRLPLSRLTFLSVNASAAYRTTFYSRGLDVAADRAGGESYVRRYAAFRSDVVGPVFTRIWDTPDSGFAERLKHVIEPAFTVDLVSAIDDYRRAPVLSDLSDFVVGGATRVTYGLTNRLLFRGRTVGGVRGQTREFLTVGLQQSYYSKPEASQYDTAYQSAYGYRRAIDLSPVALSVRVAPAAAADANLRVEYDVSGGGLQLLSGGTSLGLGSGSANVSYSRRWTDKTRPADDYLSASTTTRWNNGRASGSYSLSWDIGRGYVVSQSVQASFLAQCCGFQMEFQQFNFPEAIGIPIPADRRVNFGFVLAGLGTFSNFFGAFGPR
jgi:LPS-assembly protein